MPLQNAKPILVHRKEATDKTYRRYKGKKFSWAKGVTCVHLARNHMRNMGHKLIPIPRFRSLRGAKRALSDRGWANTLDMLDSILPRITPASMMIGDLAVVYDAIDGDGNPGIDLGAIFICAGPNKVIGWREDEDKLVVLDVSMSEIVGAWRV